MAGRCMDLDRAHEWPSLEEFFREIQQNEMNFRAGEWFGFSFSELEWRHLWKQ